MPNLLPIIITTLFWSFSITIQGFLIWALIDRKRKLHPLYSFGLGLVTLIIAFSVFCSFWNYSMSSLLSLQGFIIIILILINLASFKKHHLIKNYRRLFHSIKQIKLKSFLLIIFIILIILGPVLILRIPMSTDSQGFGVLIATVKNGGTIDSLSPFRPEIKYAYSPAFFIFGAYTSELFNLSIHEVLLILGHFFTIFLFLHMFLLGYEIHNKKFGIILVIATLITLGLFKSLFSGHYPRLLGLVLFALFTAFYIRLLKKGTTTNALYAGFTLGAIALVNTTILTQVVMIIFFFFGGAILLRRNKMNFSIKDIFNCFFLVPSIGIIVSLPWFIRIFPVLLSNEMNTHISLMDYKLWAPQLSNGLYLTVYQGIIITLLAIGGLYFACKKWDKINLFFFMWIIAAIDVSMFGLVLLVDKILPFSISPYFYPLGFAWVASIIPLAYFGALFIYSSKYLNRLKVKIKRKATLLLSISIILIILALINFPIVDKFSQKYPLLYGEFASPADIKAYEWLKENTPQDALIFNYIQQDISKEDLLFNLDNHESKWLTAISEREAIHMPAQPSFINKKQYFERLMEGQKVYLDPQSKEFTDFIKKYDVDYLVVPHFLINRSDYYQQAYRWKKTINNDSFNQKEYDAIEFLEKVYDQGNVIIYKIIKSNQKPTQKLNQLFCNSQISPGPSSNQLLCLS